MNRKKIVILGAGGIASSALPVLVENLGSNPDDISVFTKEVTRPDIFQKFGVPPTIDPIIAGKEEDYLDKYSEKINKNAHLFNLTDEVDSNKIAQLSVQRGITGQDTAIEPAPGSTDDRDKSLLERSGALEREKFLAIAKKMGPNCSTYITCSGANPGWVSYMVRAAILDIAKKMAYHFLIPKTKLEWAKLAQSIGLRTVHISEQDTQLTNYIKKPDTFVNTWSCDGFRSEGIQPSEGNWGTHEGDINMPAGAKFVLPNRNYFVMNKPGIKTLVRSFVYDRPTIGPMITHNETGSIADALTIFDNEENQQIQYCPTVLYPYCPSYNAQLSLNELNANNYVMHPKQKILFDEITEGEDRLGVLLMGVFEGRPYSYWMGSLLDIDTARRISPYNSATSLQVLAGIISAMKFCLKNPNAGMLETDDLNPIEMLDMCLPYLGKVTGDFVPFNPLDYKDPLFNKNYDNTNVFAFKNMLI